MISLPALMSASVEKAHIWIRHFSFGEMKRIISSRGLKNNVSWHRKPKPLAVNFSIRSRRILNRRRLQTRYISSDH